MVMIGHANVFKSESILVLLTYCRESSAWWFLWSLHTRWYCWLNKMCLFLSVHVLHSTVM